MPFVYLPDHSQADSQRGLCDAVRLMGLHSMLIMQCIEQALTHGPDTDPMDGLLPETIEGIPEKYITPCHTIALEIIERFNIQNYTDFLGIRPLIQKLYAQTSIINGREYVLNGDRWYNREWTRHKIKTPKHEFGVLLYLENTSGESGLAIAGSGTEFKMLKFGTVMKRNTGRMKMEVGKTLKACATQNTPESQKKLLRIYNSFDLFNMRDRSQAVVRCALEVLELARNIAYQKPCSAGDMTFHQRIGVPELLHYIELAQMQQRATENRPWIVEAPTIGLAEKCKSGKVSAEIAAMLTQFYFTPAKKARKAPAKKVPKANTVNSKQK